MPFAVYGDPIRAMGEIRDFKSGRRGEPPRESTPRRLAAIVAGDIAGYSRWMELDEDGTHARVKRIERDLIEPARLRCGALAGPSRNHQPYLLPREIG
jgi:class 3 adenylate cyclase